MDQEWTAVYPRLLPEIRTRSLRWRWMETGGIIHGRPGGSLGGSLQGFTQYMPQQHPWQQMPCQESLIRKRMFFFQSPSQQGRSTYNLSLPRHRWKSMGNT